MPRPVWRAHKDIEVTGYNVGKPICLLMRQDPLPMEYWELWTHLAKDQSK